MIFHPLLNAAATGAVETVGFFDRLRIRRRMAGLATTRARALGRPVVVVGAPSGGLVRGGNAQYTCGARPCVDLGGCRACGAPPRDVTRVGGIPEPDDSAVVLCQYVLEYVDDPEAAMAEMLRVAGARDNVFVARVQGWATGTRLITNAKHRIVAAPPDAEFTHHPVRRPRLPLPRRRGVE